MVVLYRQTVFVMSKAVKKVNILIFTINGYC